MRIKFQKGKQREFLKQVLLRINSPTIKELANRMQISYSTLKNYFNESRKLPKSLFEDFCFVSMISPEEFDVELLDKNWGQVKGGRVGRRYS